MGSYEGLICMFLSDHLLDLRCRFPSVFSNALKVEWLENMLNYVFKAGSSGDPILN